ncbi:MAG: hypothetical protein PHR01_09505 [Sphaerochaetaceae bacterium]|nr:hypothetical protein [Sphaerochaetaceae bacterium]
MNKRIVIASIVILLVMFSVFGDSFDLGIGPFTQFQENPFSPDVQYATWVDANNYLPGYEVRLRIRRIEIDTYLISRQGNIIDVTPEGKPIYEQEISRKISGTVSIGSSTEVAAFTRLGFAVGFPMGLDIHKGSQKYSFWIGSDDNMYSKPNWVPFYQHISIHYRMKLDFRIAPYVLSVAYEVPSNDFSIVNFNQKALLPRWEQGRISFAFITMFL